MFKMPLDELRTLMASDNAASPVHDERSALTIEDYGPDVIVGTALVTEDHTRKGGTIAGNTIFSFFDAIGYLATVAQAPKGTEAFTSEVTIHFLRPGPVGRVVVEARPMRFGKRASVVAVTVSSPLVADGPIASGFITFAPVFPDA